MVTQVPQVTNWSVTPQNGQVNYFTLMNTWLFESTSVISSLNTAITKINEASNDINEIGTNAINAITFDNIVQLKLHSNIGRVDVLGYYIKGDGGGGTFYWDATSTEDDNGGTIIQATGVTTGRWKRVFSGAVNVKWFGAKGDGVDDDTIAIQKSINSSNDIFIPNGLYKTTSTLHYKSNTKIAGESTSIKPYYGYSIEVGTIIVVKGSIEAFAPLDKTAGYSGNCFSNLSFYVESKNTGSSYGQLPNYLAETTAINITGLKESYFHNIFFANYDKGFYSESLAIVTEQHTARNIFNNIKAFDTNRVFKFDYNGVGHSYSADNTFTSITSIIHCGTCFDINKMDGITISNSTIFHCSNSSININNSIFINISNSKCFETGDVQCQISNSNYVNIQGTFSRAGWYNNTKKEAIILVNCNFGAINALIERSNGDGITINNSNDIDIASSMLEIGYDNYDSKGLYIVNNSSNICVNANINKGSISTNSVVIDFSTSNITGSITTNGIVLGKIKNINFSNQYDFIGNYNAMTMGASGSSEVSRKRIYLKANQRILLTGVSYYNVNGLGLRVGSQYFTTPTVYDAEKNNFNTVLLHTAISDGHYDLLVYQHNPTGGAVNATNSDSYSFKIIVV